MYRAGDHHHGDPAPTTGLNSPFDHGDDFHRSAPCDGYSSITDYLQGFLQESDGAGMAVEQAGDHLAAGGAPSSPGEGIKNSEEVDDEEEQGSATDPNCKGSSDEKKKKNKKAARAARVAFVTKSEVDHLEDGYRWRKYGQKAVKNSSFPRSYYRCTAARCGVKKLVERSQQDPSSVITTYEGQHTHPCPVAHCMGIGRAGGTLHRHQLGRFDDLGRTHGSPAAAVGTPPPPINRQEDMRDRV